MELAETLNNSESGKLSTGDAEAWRVLLGRCIPLVYGMYVKKGVNPGLAEELVQKTVFDAVRGRHLFDPTRGTAESWMFGIASKNLAGEMRKLSRRPDPNTDLIRCLEKIDSEPLPDAVLEQKENAQLVVAAMDELKTEERTVLAMKYLDDLSARQIAPKMGITEKAVHSLLYRTRISLREKLKTLAPSWKGGETK